MLVDGSLGNGLIQRVEVAEVVAPILVQLGGVVGTPGSICERAKHGRQHHDGKEHEHGTTSRRRDARSEVQHHHAAGSDEHGQRQQADKRIGGQGFRDLRRCIQCDITFRHRWCGKSRFAGEVHRLKDVAVARLVPFTGREIAA
jgi:hypothetical protein